MYYVNNTQGLSVSEVKNDSRHRKSQNNTIFTSDRNPKTALFSIVITSLVVKIFIV